MHNLSKDRCDKIRRYASDPAQGGLDPALEQYQFPLSITTAMLTLAYRYSPASKGSSTMKLNSIEAAKVPPTLN